MNRRRNPNRRPRDEFDASAEIETDIGTDVGTDAAAAGTSPKRCGPNPPGEEPHHAPNHTAVARVEAAE